MREPLLDLVPLYVAALRGHLLQASELSLHQAYEVGRRALGRGVSVLDLVKVHHDTLAELVRDEEVGDPTRAMTLAAEFLSEAMSPFEMALRSYHETNLRLVSVNAELIEANAAVVAASERLKAEESERQRAEQALFHTQKLKAVGLLAGGVAHHFNNLLTVMLGNLELARRRIAGDAEIDRFLLAARRGAERGAEVTRQLLTFSRQQVLQPTRLALAGWLGEFSPLLSTALRGDITVQIEVDGSVWPIEVDPSQLELALLNLCVNARDAMPDGGVLRLSADNRSLDDERLGLRGDFVVLSVSDTGTGVAPDLLGRVFEPFFTTKTKDPGTGLGLSQVHGFVHQSGGGVEMDSVPGRGATVRLYLPAAAGATADAPSEVVAPRARQSRGNVLVVEDDIEVANVAAELLQNCGYSVKLAYRAQAALDMVRGGERVDLIFSDMVMPGGMNGMQLAEEVSVRFPSLPILLATGYSDALAGACARGFAVISKPYNGEDLRERIDRLIAHA